MAAALASGRATRLATVAAAASARPRGTSWRSERRALDRGQPGRPAGRRARAGRPAVRRATRAVAARLGGGRARRPRSRPAADALPDGLDGRDASPERAIAVVDGLGGGPGRARPAGDPRRGYAIVRRTADGSIVRDPAEAPAGTGARRSASPTGTIAATVDDRRPARPADRSSLVFVVVVVVIAGRRDRRRYAARAAARPADRRRDDEEPRD